MKMFTESQHRSLLVNGAASAVSEGGIDHAPVVRLFLPEGKSYWLLSEIDPQNPDIAFGLVDLGMGEPELGYVSITELSRLRTRLGLPIERDIVFNPTGRLTDYLREARSA